MYKKNPAIEQFTIKTKSLLKELQVTAEGLDTILEKIEKATVSQEWLPHALNLPCCAKDGAALFLRVIIWQDPQLHTIRRNGIATQHWVSENLAGGVVR